MDINVCLKLTTINFLIVVTIHLSINLILLIRKKIKYYKTKGVCSSYMERYYGSIFGRRCSFKYNLNEEEQHAFQKKYLSNKEVISGEIRTIYANPDNPKEIYTALEMRLLISVYTFLIICSVSSLFLICL